VLYAQKSVFVPNTLNNGLDHSSMHLALGVGVGDAVLEEVTEALIEVV
jgi:hypothetical protein